ncbi:MAG: [Fe-Fe] hydrogenase large subunit C-terminal domain-containing protein [Oscillospiraceae bacterium]
MDQFLDFEPAKCRDCYRCLRECPVKAIRIIDHQARIIPERCILCGNCTRVCPQNAKTVHSQLEEVRRLLNSQSDVLASVDPSFVSAFELENFGQMAAVLEQLGFFYAEETAVGAAAVTQEYARLMQEGKYKNLISSACPAINRMIQIYRPEMLKYLAPVDSPMVAHAKILRQSFPDAKIVFVGPCVARMREAAESDVVDAVLTFEDLKTMMEEGGVSFPPAEAAERQAQGASARIYPIAGGIIRSFPEGLPGYTPLSIDGVRRCMSAERCMDELDHAFIEMSCCEYACVNGPCSLQRQDAAALAEVKVRRYAAQAEESGVSLDGAELGRRYPRLKEKGCEPPEQEIRAILAKTGKTKKEDELDCGACGYETCREKAWAVYNGFADVEMCLPHMRQKAESVSSEVMQRMPNGVVVLNSLFEIEEINLVASRLLDIDYYHYKGRNFFDLSDIVEFIQVQSSGENLFNRRVKIGKTQKYVEISIINMKDHDKLLGIMKDVTEEETYNEKLREVREQTFAVTDQVVKNQMKIAQDIASLLGETTAETKVALLKLKEILRSDQ